MTQYESPPICSSLSLRAPSSELRVQTTEDEGRQSAMPNAPRTATSRKGPTLCRRPSTTIGQLTLTTGRKKASHWCVFNCFPSRVRDTSLRFGRRGVRCVVALKKEKRTQPLSIKRWCEVSVPRHDDECAPSTGESAGIMGKVQD